MHLRVHVGGARARHGAHRLIHERVRLARLALQDAVHRAFNENSFVLYCLLLGGIRECLVFVLRRQMSSAWLVAR